MWETLKSQKTFVVVGAGVVGLTTALSLIRRQPEAKVFIVAKEVPGDSSPSYASAWAGANWYSAATDNGPQEEWDRATYKVFQELSEKHPEAGIERMDMRSIFDQDPGQAGVLSDKTGKIWFEDLVGGLRYLPSAELPAGAKFGYDFSTFVINVQTYLPWLQFECKRYGVDIHRMVLGSLEDVKKKFPRVSAIFNCTGLGSLTLGGIKDKALYPGKGQVYLVEGPAKPITKMYFRSSRRLDTMPTYIMPRGQGGGVILGGLRVPYLWDEKFDDMVGEDIKRRCIALCPDLGDPKDLRILKQGVGFRPYRKGGARIEREEILGVTIIHNYGAGGAGYQASWGMAKAAIDLLLQVSKL